MCGITGAVITMAASLVLPLGAQSQSDGVFGEITCTGITVRHSDSSEHVTLTPSTIAIGSSEGLGAHILVSGGTGALSLGERPTFLLGGESSYLAVNGKNGAVIMDVAQPGGSVAVYAKGSDESRARMTVNEFGNGAVSTWDKNGYSMATLK